MPILPRRPFLHPGIRMSLDKRERATTSLGGSLSILKRSPQHPSEGSPPSIKDTGKSSAKKNCKDYLDIPSGTTLSNYSLEPLRRYQDDSSPSLRAKSPKRRSS